MFTVVTIMSIGIIVGYIIRNKRKIVKVSDRLTMAAIYLLLFLLGLSIGANEMIVKNLPLLGAKALLITLGGVFGSVIVAWLVYSILLKPKNKSDEG